MVCTDIAAPLYYFFSSEAPELLYYSHIPTSISALLLSLFVFRRDRNSLSAKIFLAMTLFFFLWSMTDLALWANVDGGIILFLWSFINVFESITSALVLYFAYVFLEGRDAPARLKLIVMGLLLPFIIFMPTHFNLAGFDLVNCEALQGPLVYYFYIVEIILFLWLIGYLVKKYRTVTDQEKRKVGFFSIGVALFLLFFSGTNIIGSMTQAWDILMFGFFGVPIFLGLIVWLIVYYKAFDVKLISVQALVIGLIILAGSQFFFTKDFFSLILVLITLALVAIIGYILIREVKKEIKRKEELQAISHTLAVANERLKELDMAKSEFISIASHQLRTPLTAIRGYISLVLEGSYGKVTPSVQEVLNKVYLVNNRMGQLVEDLLSISRIESGRVQYNFVEAQLEPIVTDVVDMFALIAKTKGLALKIKLPKKTLPLLRLDTSKIREVVSNLIDNAIKYTKEGSVTVTVEALPEVVMIKVTDTGIGVDPKNADRLFEKFTRSSETMKLDVSGTGLGLYVGKNFVEAHGGLLTVESEGPGKGSSFIIKLPVNHTE